MLKEGLKRILIGQEIPNRPAWICLVLMSIFYIGLAYHSLVQKSVTIDEFGHLPVGFNVLKRGDFRYCELNPPLMNMISSLPLLGRNLIVPATPREIPEAHRYSFWANGYFFMHYHRPHYHELFVAARMMTVAVTVLLGLFVFLWARMLVPVRKGSGFSSR